MKWKKAVALGLAAMMTLGVVGCGDKETGAQGSEQSSAQQSSESTSENSGAESSGEDASGGGAPEGGYAADDVIEIEVYDVAANYHGIQSGWFAKLVAEKFGLKLSILAPQVSGDPAGLYQTRCSDGHLGDIVLLDNADFIECIDAGLIKDITDSVYSYENLAVFKTQIDTWNGMIGDGSKIYGIPTEMSNTSPEKYSVYIGMSALGLLQRAGFSGDQESG